MKGSFAHKNIYSIKPNWRGGGDDVSSQQSVVRDRCAWETCSSQEVPKHWLSVGQWEKSFYLMTRKRLSQRAPVNTDEINELAQGRKLSRQAMSPPLHLYNINTYLNKKSVLIVLLCKEGSKQ